MSGYTRADNWLWDYVMPKAKPNTFKVVSAVMRMTSGWHRDAAAITFDEFQDMTGIAGRSTLNRAISDALDEGFISRYEDGRGYIYQCETSPDDSTETVPSVVPKQDYQQYQNGTANSTKTVPSTTSPKEKSKQKLKGDDPILSLADYFTEVSGIFSNPGAWDEGWKQPLGLILDRAGGVDKAKDVIKRAVTFARDGPKRYTITSPLSITTIAANLPEHSSSGALKVGSR